MATPLTIVNKRTISASEPASDVKTGWLEVGGYRKLQLTYKVETPSGTTPRLDVYMEATNDSTSTSANAVEVPGSRWCATDQADDTTLVFDVTSEFARPNIAVAGTSPKYTLSIFGVGVE